jgi:hypothetical protein
MSFLGLRAVVRASPARVCERKRAWCSGGKVTNRNVRDFGWEIAHAAVSRRPPISLYTIVPLTGGCAKTVGIVHRSRTIFCRAVPAFRVATFSSLSWKRVLEGTCAASLPRVCLSQGDGGGESGCGVVSIAPTTKPNTPFEA